jgi:hypothetical protein
VKEFAFGVATVKVDGEPVAIVTGNTQPKARCSTEPEALDRRARREQAEKLLAGPCE